MQVSPITADEAVQTEESSIRIPIQPISPTRVEKSTETVDHDARPSRKTPKKERVKVKKVQYPKNEHMMPYGMGNTKRSTEREYMKTFNVTAPPSEVMPSTLTHALLKTYVANRLLKRKQNPSLVRDINLAQQTLDENEPQFLTEYTKEYQNWPSFCKELRNDGVEWNSEIAEVISNPCLYLWGAGPAAGVRVEPKTEKRHYRRYDEDDLDEMVRGFKNVRLASSTTNCCCCTECGDENEYESVGCTSTDYRN